MVCVCGAQIIRWSWVGVERLLRLLDSLSRPMPDVFYLFDLDCALCRYPYVSGLSAHFCPLVRVGSAAPFTASRAEDGAVATAIAKMENLAKVVRLSYSLTFWP